MSIFSRNSATQVQADDGQITDLESEMKLFYTDESGTSFRDKGSSSFLLAAFSIDANCRSALDSQLAGLKRSIFPYMTKPEDFEIKGRDIRRGDGLFKKLNWEERLRILAHLAEIVAATPCRVFGAKLDKPSIRGQIESDEDAYRITFSRLLDSLNQTLMECGDQGLLLMDARSDLHSSVQDRRLVDAYRLWSETRSSLFIELPWFGFSAFYSGLQLADYCAYMLDFVHNEVILPAGISDDFQIIYDKASDKALVAALNKMDLGEARRIMDMSGCTTLLRLLNKSSAAELADIISTNDLNSAHGRLVNTERYRAVIDLFSIFQEKVQLVTIP